MPRPAGTLSTQPLVFVGPACAVPSPGGLSKQQRGAGDQHVQSPRRSQHWILDRKNKGMHRMHHQILDIFSVLQLEGFTLPLVPHYPLKPARSTNHQGFPVDCYTHGLQTATLALRDGCDEETVVCALLHDLGECWSTINHGEIAASLLRPYISPKNYWILKHHEVFQAYIYQNGFELKDIEKVRDQFKDSPHFDACVQFCERYDSKAFDPEYDTLPLEHFIPMIKRIFNRKPYVESGCLEDGRENAAKFSLGEAYPSPEPN